jgi:hypothetical protein
VTLDWKSNRAVDVCFGRKQAGFKPTNKIFRQAWVFSSKPIGELSYQITNSETSQNSNALSAVGGGD